MSELEKGGPSPLVALQYVCLAYRLSWLVRELTFPSDDNT
jgi:hypothetical protein